MSYQIKLDPKSRKAARFIAQLQKKIQRAFLATGKTQQEVATSLGVDRSVINRRLTGSANLTARTIAEFAFAFDKDVYIEFVDKPRTFKPNASTSSGTIHPVQKHTALASGIISPNAKPSFEKTAA